jgi:hypothetical protein
VEIAVAQGDVRRIYRGGFSGPLVSIIVWSVANAVFYWGSPGAGMTVLFIGGMFIFPLGTLVLKVMGGPTALPQGHPSAALAIQCAFTVPLGLLVAVVLGTYEPLLFFPASLIIVGAHYLVFISLYGMKLFAVLAGTLIVIGVVTLFWLPDLGDISGWLGAAVFLVFAVLLFRTQRRDGAHPRPAAA